MQPRTLGKYEILDVLGTGGMGTVYRALDPVLQRIVAIKLLNREYGPDLGSNDVRARFRTEARAVARFNHPAIVSVYDFCDTDPAGAFFVMEYVDGFTLDHYMSDKQQGGLAHTFELMTQLLDGLGYAHVRDVVHRDIKPSNLLVTRDGQLKITDFGIAKVGLLKQTQTGMAIGTPEYMAPEQYTGGAIDQRCDLYAAGTLFFQLLTGRPPFNGTTTQVMYQICHVTPDPVSTTDPAIPKLLDPILAKVLAKDPNDRFQTAKEFSDAISVARKALRITSAQLVRSPSAAPATRQRISTGKESSSNGEEVQDQVAPTSDPRVAPRDPIVGSEGTTLPPIGWSVQQLAEIEKKLAPILGPMAKVLIKRAAALTRDRGQLLNDLSKYLKTDDERKRFLNGAHVGIGSQPMSPEPNEADTSSRDEIALATIDRTKKILTRYIGPIAVVLVNKTAPTARNEIDFYKRLAERINNPAERDRFMAEVRRRY
jgi:serine/threonine-protein kinase